MKTLNLPILGLFAAALCPSLIATNAEAQSTHREPFAVVELFTSEGCSSTPPAEQVVTRLHKQAMDEDSRVFTMDFHVDYWDDLGWVDRYGSALASRRQREYARMLPNDSPYTPQMVVNGRTEFNGSNQPKAERAIEAALGQPAAVGLGIELKNTPEPGKPVAVAWKLDDSLDEVMLHVAVVENGLTVEIKAGENRGRTMTHPTVVRNFLRRQVEDTAGELSLELPESLELGRSSVVVWVTAGNEPAILNAQRVMLNQ